jgi:hypothetical protein
MQRIPGTDDFLTQESARYHLYRVDAAGELTEVAPSTSMEQVVATATFAFVGAEVDHLLTADGALIAMHRFPPDGGTSAAPPFVRDGTLGTLGDQQTFAALDRAGKDDVVGLVADRYSSCASGCALQRIGVASRTITSSRAHALTADNVVLLRHDSTADAVWVGTSPSAPASGRAAGYRIELLRY